MHALQDLGVRLVDLDSARLAELGLPDRLVEAIVAARTIRAHGGRRRQLQYIGKLMREVDPAPIEARFEAWARGPAAEVALHRAAESWRERLLADADALDAWIACRPAVDRRGLAAMIARARAERSDGRPPRACRELYRLLRGALGDAASLEEPTA